MSLEGYQLDHYRIVRLLGSGGMGDVYLAEDERIGQQVALKVIRVEVSAYPAVQDVQKATHQFRREARAIAMLDHPHILPLYSYGEQQVGDKTIMYLVMPYRSEGSLAHWMHQRGSVDLLPPGQAAQIIHQAAEALQHAHDRQIIHQDVKPSNFLIRSREKAQSVPDILLADFGIAKLTTTASSTSQSIRGTPVYMAPEQWQGKPTLASDQYALGIMAYELLTGHPPFLGVPGTVMFQHLTTTPTPPSALNPLLSVEVDTAVLQALAKEPEARFPSILAFASALENTIWSLDQHAAPVINATNPRAVVPPVSNATYIGPTLIADNSPTLPASRNRQNAITPNLVSEENRSSTPPPLTNDPSTPASLARNALITSPDSFSAKQANTSVASRFFKLRTVLLLGLVLLLLLGSSGFIYAAIVNQQSPHNLLTPTTGTGGTNFALATSNAATTIGASQAAQASATALAVNATVTARDATATAQAITTATAMANNATATVVANSNPTVQPSPYPTVQQNPSPTTVPPVQTPTRPVSGVRILGYASNLNGYCQSIGDSSALLTGNTAYSWVCVTPDGQHVGIWVDYACQWQYNLSGAIARLANYSDPNSWECWG